MPISRRKQKTSASWPIVILALLVAVGTWFSLAFPEPEQHSIASSDGAVRIDGVWIPSAEPKITRRDDLKGPFTSVQGFVYELSGAPAPDGSPYRVTFTVPPSLGFAQATLLNYDPGLSAWRPIHSTLSADQWSLTMETPRLPVGVWAVGRMPSLPASTSDAFTTLTDAPPPGAVGYRTFTASSTALDDFVLDESARLQGGCAGHFAVGARRTKTSLDLRLAGGIRRLIVEWQISEGCPADQPLASS